MSLQKNNLQTTQEWTKSYIELIASYVHQCVRQVYFTKSWQKIWMRVNQLYTIYKSHLRWNSTMRHSFYHTDLGQKAVFHNFEYKLHSFNIQDDRSTRGLLANSLKKISKITYTASRFSLLQCELWRVFEWTLKELSSNINKEFIMFIIYLMVWPAAFWVLLHAMFTERLKTNGTAIKITKETTNNQ